MLLRLSFRMYMVIMEHMYIETTYELMLGSYLYMQSSMHSPGVLGSGSRDQCHTYTAAALPTNADTLLYALPDS